MAVRSTPMNAAPEIKVKQAFERHHDIQSAYSPNVSSIIMVGVTTDIGKSDSSSKKLEGSGTKGRGRAKSIREHRIKLINRVFESRPGCRGRGITWNDSGSVLIMGQTEGLGKVAHDAPSTRQAAAFSIQNDR